MPVPNLFTYNKVICCAGCLLPFRSIPEHLRNSPSGELCLRCYEGKGGRPGTRRQRGSCDAVAGTPGGGGLVTSAIKEQNAKGCVGPETLARFTAAIRVLRRDVEVKRYISDAKARVVSEVRNMRGRITELSRKSLRGMVKTARNLPDLGIMITLTFPGDFPTDGKFVKYCWKRFKQWLTYRGVGGFWFLEFQKRGAPHFHVYVNGYIDHTEVAKKWYSIVNSGDPRHLVAGTRIESLREDHALAAYAEKYSAKQEQKDVPPEYSDVGRFWGRFGGVAVQERFVVVGDLGDNTAVSVTAELPLDPRELQEAKDARFTPVVSVVQPEQLEAYGFAFREARGAGCSVESSEVAGAAAASAPIRDRQDSGALVSRNPDLAPAVRVIERLYRADRVALRAAGRKVKPVTSASLGWGRRSFTAWGIGEAAAQCLSRLLPEVAASGA